MTDYDSTTEPASAEDEEAMVKATMERIQSEIRIGALFAECAKWLGEKYGYDPDLLRAGAIHWLAEDHSSREDFIDEIESAADSLCFEDDEDEDEDDDE
jgi:hypothetical protein